MAQLIKKLGELDQHSTKTELVQLAQENANAIIESQRFDLLKMYIELKRYDAYLKTLIETTKQHALQKAVQQGQKSFDYNHANVCVAVRTKWDFSDDPTWNELDTEIQRLTQLKKDRETYLKEQENINSFVDITTGEYIEKTNFITETKPELIIRLS